MADLTTPLGVLAELVACEGVSDIGMTQTQWRKFLARKKKAWKAAWHFVDSAPEIAAASALVGREK